MTRLLKPATVLKRWQAACKKQIALYNAYKRGEGKRCSRLPGRKVARQHSNMCGMKSMLEVEVAADMDKRKIKWAYEQEKLTYQYEPQKYEPDFTLLDTEDKLIEVKGKMTGDVRKKLLAIQRCNPKRKIYLVFGNANNKLSTRKNSKRYSQWAEQHGFEWSERKVLDEWVK
jgi:hypothetical protein